MKQADFLASLEFGRLRTAAEQADAIIAMCERVRLQALEEAARFCADLGHPHASSEIRRQLIKREVAP